jgi:anti-sigma-K factor RskA
MSQILARTEKRRIEAELTNTARNAKSLTAENLRMRSALDETAGRLNRRPSEVAERVKPVNPNGIAEEALSRDLNEARLSAASSAESLAEARAQIDELRVEISRYGGLLTAATQQREEADRRYKAAVEQSLRERDAEVAVYKTQIRQVETQIVQYRQMVDALQRRLNQHLLIASMLRSPGVALVRLRATEAGGAAMANALIDERSKLMFYAWNLPALRPGRTFQVWLIRGRGPAIVSAGTFNSGAADGAVLQFSNAGLLADITGVAVTEEPSGGSPLPTGHKLLIGMLRG